MSDEFIAREREQIRRTQDDDLERMHTQYMENILEQVSLENKSRQDRRIIGIIAASFAVLTIILLGCVVFFVLTNFGEKLELAHSVIVSASILGGVAMCAKLVGVMNTPREESGLARNMAEIEQKFRSGGE